MTGDHLPERYVWRLAVALISFPRFMDGILYYNFFATQKPNFHLKRWYRWLNKLNWFLLTSQLFLFFTFTFVSSKENMGEYHIAGHFCQGKILPKEGTIVLQK